MTSVLPRSSRPAAASVPTMFVRTGLGVGLALVLASLGACSVQVGGDDTLSAAEVATQLDPQLQEMKGAGAEIKDLSCDGELRASVDDEQRCHFTDVYGDRYGLSVVVTEVADGDVSFDLAVDPGQTLEPDELEPELVTQLTKVSGGTPPDDVTCPDDLPGIVEASVTCVLTAGPDRLETFVTVTAAQGPEVSFDLEVAEETLP